MFLEISQNSQEKTCARVSFLIKLQASGLGVFLVRIFPHSDWIQRDTHLFLQNTSGGCFCFLQKYLRASAVNCFIKSFILHVWQAPNKRQRSSNSGTQNIYLMKFGIVHFKSNRIYRNPFHATGSFYTPWKPLVFGRFKGGMKETSGMKWVNNLIKSLLSKMRFVETSGYFKFVNVSLDIQPSCVPLINQV